MKIYRFALCAFVFTLSLFFAPCRLAAADSAVKYSRVLGDDVTLYMDADLTKAWFVLPYSYYVKILSVGTRSVKVEYKGESTAHPSVKGYISIEDIAYSDEPIAPYPSAAFEIGASCLLYRDANFSYSETVTENSGVDFYGTFIGKNGKEYVYGYVSTTSGDNYMGYIEKSAVKNFVVPRLKVEENKPEEISEAPDSEEPAPKSVSGDSLQIIIVVGISVVAISIVYLLFRPSPQRAKEEAISDDGGY